jgi:hypothetical protein
MYRALYRKWRPQRFEDVVGQRAIVTALKNQITAGRVGHAYLFTGVRGTGKTTCAKIFAKAVNCLHPEGGDPCGECEICKGIDNGSLLDVVEMDAASNNGVDDIRDLRDEANGTAYGLTIFPDDGSTPIVCISAEAPISAAPELLAHELAHVATPEDTEHGESWSTASEAIFKKYNELLEKLIPGEPEPIVTPYLPAVLSIGDAIAMPLRDNIPDPPTDDWQLTTCPACGAECWQTDTVRRILEQEPKARTVCTACALKGLGK